MCCELHALLSCSLPPCEEVRQAAERELLEENRGTLAKRHLISLESAIGRLLRCGPQLRGGEGRDLFLRLCLVLASGLRGPLFGAFCAEVYWADYASDVGRGYVWWDIAKRYYVAIIAGC
jgi:hypothetical protein